MMSLAKRVPIGALIALLLAALGSPTGHVFGQTPVPTTARIQTFLEGVNTVNFTTSRPSACNFDVSSSAGVPLSENVGCSVGEAQVAVGARVSPSSVFDPANPNAYSVAELGVFNQARHSFARRSIAPATPSLYRCALRPWRRSPTTCSSVPRPHPSTA